MAVTLDFIHSQCEEVGDCLEWQGYMGQGAPRVYDRETCHYFMVRRVIVEQARGLVIPHGMRCSARCGNARCVLDAHIMLRSYTQIGQATSKAGRYSTPSIRAAKTTYRRSRNNLKLSIEKAREIRASDLSSDKEAAKHGVSGALVRSIRANRVWREAVAGSSVFAQ